MTDLEKAKKIVAKHAPYVGAGGSLPDNVAQAVVDGIALGRKEGLELAAKLIAEKIKDSG
jgi:hypothetical protein